VTDLPPGPGTLGALRFVRAPFAFLDACARRYGEWVTLRVPGFPPFVFTSHPDAVREAFTGDPNQLRAGEANASLGAFMGTTSLLLLDGDAHQRRRRLLLPPLHGEHLHAHAAAMRRITDDIIDGWPIDRPFPVHRSMRAITFAVILDAVLGVGEFPGRARLRQYLERLFALFASPRGALLGAPWMRVDLGPWSPWGCAVRLRRELDGILFAEFDRRRATAGDDRDDLLALLLAARDERGLALSNATLRDELLTLLLAGHETTAASLAWVVNRLLGRADVMRTLADEVRGAVAADRPVVELPYLDAVIKETSRLDPVIPNVGRLLATPLAIGDRTLPAGAVLAPCIYLVHRRPDLWRDPERFMPERFLGAPPSPHAFFPFGGGPRRCIGAALAGHGMKIVLGRVLARCELAAVAGYRARLVRRGIAFTPSEGMPVVLTARTAAG
jgi:cytochrome P450 family 110